MCVLSDDELKKALSAGRIGTYPLVQGVVQPNSIDVHLGRYIKYSVSYERQVYDIRQPSDDTEYVTIDLRTAGQFLLGPKQFALGMTLEHVTVPNDLACTLEGRSGIGRTGLFIMNAGRVDSGWVGNLTLELFNAEKWSLVLYEGMPIGQLVFSTVHGTVRYPYGSLSNHNKYLGDIEPQPSRMWKNYK